MDCSANTTILWVILTSGTMIGTVMIAAFILLLPGIVWFHFHPDEQ